MVNFFASEANKQTNKKQALEEFQVFTAKSKEYSLMQILDWITCQDKFAGTCLGFRDKYALFQPRSSLKAF